MLITLLGSVNEKLNKIFRRANKIFDRVNESENELRAMVNVRPLLGGFPLKYGVWAMDAHFAETVARLLLQERPTFVVECGSGSSTLLIARCLEKLGGERSVVSLDHEPKYANSTRQLVEQQHLENRATVLTAPLRAWKLNGEEKPWYGIDLDSWPDRKIDLLVVDGPPGQTGPLARYPAVPLLKERLARDCIIVIDDGDRPDEHEMAHRWAEELDGELQYAGGAKGTWIIRGGKGSLDLESP